MEAALFWLGLLSLLGALVSFVAGISERVMGRPSLWHFISAVSLFITFVLMFGELYLRSVLAISFPL
ncbi:MAG: hypothetical protein KBC16_01645 [Candidatus Pacebacteria bacterium]|nr:hypothetical protein [Candidatus Paceibacterota bacterium]